ncbi:MAG: hypothetical protein AB7P21_17285 [Lautropia sp.]
MVVVKSIALWFLILFLAIANGVFREAVLLTLFARDAAFTASGLLLIACILVVSLLAVPWLGRLTLAGFGLVGLFWLALTVAFEFGFGLLVRRQPMTVLLDAYRFEDGNLWPLVLVVVAVAPVAAAAVRGVAGSRRLG